MNISIVTGLQPYQLLFLLLLGFVGCSRSELPPPYVLEEISKNNRELLGKRLELSLLTQPDLFPIRSAIDTSITIYDYLQSYYNQANYFYKLDLDTPPEDRWNAERVWKVRILETESANAFCLPGGDFYISVGMLKAINNESELYALMSFELTLMQHRFILEEIAEQFVAEDFVDLMELGTANGGLDRQDLFAAFINIKYENIQVSNIDELTVEHICNSSAFQKESLSLFLQAIQNNNADNWLENKSYNGRISNLGGLVELPSCGARITDGSYQKNVLDLL